MNTHMTTKEYREGYRAFDPAVATIGERRARCPYAAGSTQAMLWIEGWNDASDDADRQMPKVTVAA